MKVEMYTKTLDDYRESLEIVVDGEAEFTAIDGEPEDNSLCRNFNDCYKIVDLMEKAYEAGKRGEPMEVVHEEGKSYLFD